MPVGLGAAYLLMVIMPLTSSIWCGGFSWGFCFFGFFKVYFIYLFLAALGLCSYAWAFSNCGEQGLLFVAVHRLLIVVASLAEEHGL